MPESQIVSVIALISSVATVVFAIITGALLLAVIGLKQSNTDLEERNRQQEESIRTLTAMLERFFRVEQTAAPNPFRDSQLADMLTELKQLRERMNRNGDTNLIVNTGNAEQVASGRDSSQTKGGG